MHNNQQLTNKGSFVNQGKQGNALQLKGSKVCMPFEKYSQNNNYITLLNLTALDGVPIHSLKEEDYHLVHGFDDSDSEHDFTYHERMPQALLNEEGIYLVRMLMQTSPPRSGSNTLCGC